MVNRYSDIEAFFKTYIDLDKDKSIFEKIKKFRLEWAVKRIDNNYTNLDFLSGITMGVQNIRFSKQDESRLTNDIFNIDIDKMQEDFYRVEGIVKEFKVASNVLYQLLLYTIRHILVNKLPIEYLYETYYIMAYKMISSLLVVRFDYNLDPRVANAVAERMTEKFKLKELGSWQKFFEYRATFLLPESKNGVRLINSYSASTAMLVVADLQVNIRSTVNRLFSLIVDTNNEDLSISTDSLMKMENEEVVLSNLKSYGRYSKVVLDKISTGDFIDDNYIYLITEVSSNLQPIPFKTVLDNIVTNSLEDFKEIETIVNDVLRTSLNYLMRTDSIGSMDSNILSVLKSLKSFYSSSTVRDPVVVELKEMSLKLVTKSTTIKTSWMLSAMNINLILYIVLIALVKK